MKYVHKKLSFFLNHVLVPHYVKMSISFLIACSGVQGIWVLLKLQMQVIWAHRNTLWSFISLHTDFSLSSLKGGFEMAVGHTVSPSCVSSICSITFLNLAIFKFQFDLKFQSIYVIKCIYFHLMYIFSFDHICAAYLWSPEESTRSTGIGFLCSQETLYMGAQNYILVLCKRSKFT